MFFDEEGHNHNSEPCFPKFCCNIERGVHMIRQIRNFLNISCFPNFRGDLQGMSGPKSHIQGEGQCRHFGIMVPQEPVKRRGGAGGLRAKPGPNALPFGMGVGHPCFSEMKFWQRDQERRKTRWSRSRNLYTSGHEFLKKDLATFMDLWIVCLQSKNRMKKKKSPKILCRK